MAPSPALSDHLYFTKKKHANAKELIARLQTIATELQHQPQPPEGTAPPITKELAKAIVADGYARNTNKQVQLLVGQAVADVFRLFAPKNPFTLGELKEVFELWLRQFELLVTEGDRYARSVVYILERAATLKVFCILADSRIDGIDDLFEQLFDLFLNRVDADAVGQPTMTRQMEDILVSCLEESGELTLPVVQHLLNNLRGAARKHRRHGYRLGRAVIGRCTEKLGSVLCQVVTESLEKAWAEAEARLVRGAPAAEVEEGKRGVTGQFEIMEEFADIEPDLLTTLLGGTTMRRYVAAQEKQASGMEDLRGKAIRGLCNVFVAHPSMRQKYPQCLQLLIERCRDSAKAIRLKLLKWVLAVLSKDAAYWPLLELPLKHLLQDKEESVRRQAVSTVLELLQHSPDHPRALALLPHVVQRCMPVEKKSAVRASCLQRLCELYAHLAPTWVEAAADPSGSSPLLKRQQHYRCIPTAVFSCWRDPDILVREAVSSALYKLLPIKRPGKEKDKEKEKDKDKSDSEAAQEAQRQHLAVVQHSQCFVDIFRCVGLDETLFRGNVLHHILKDKGQFRDKLAALLRAKEEKDEYTLERELKELAVLEPDEKDWEHLLKLKDQRVFQRLLVLCDPARPLSTIHEIIQVGEQTLSKVRACAAEDTVAAFAQRVVARVVFPITPAHVECLLDALGDALPAKRWQYCTEIAATLAHLATAWPALVSEYGERLTDVLGDVNALETPRPQLLNYLLRTIAAIAGHFDTEAASDCHRLLEEVAGASPFPATRKRALFALTAFGSSTDGALRRLSKQLAQTAVAAKSSRAQVIGSLAGLVALARNAYPVVAPHVPAVLSKLQALLDSLCEGKKKSSEDKDWGAPSEGSVTFILGIKLLVACLLQPETDLGLDPIAVFKRLFDRIRQLAGGDTPGHSHKLCAVVKGVMKLGRLPFYRKQLTADHRRALVYAQLLDDNPRARESMCTAAFKYLRTDRLPMNDFAPLMMLHVIDSDRRNATAAKQQVNELIAYCRARQERASHGRTNLESEMAPLVCAEYILPALVYFLGHHPNYEDLAPHYEPIQICLYVYFNAVMRDRDNAPFFFKLLNTLRSTEDRFFTPGPQHHQEVAEIAFRIVQEINQKKNSTATYPGAVSLPRLFSEPKPMDVMAKKLLPEFRLLPKAKALRFDIPHETAAEKTKREREGSDADHSEPEDAPEKKKKRKAPAVAVQEPKAEAATAAQKFFSAKPTKEAKDRKPSAPPTKVVPPSSQASEFDETILDNADSDEEDQALDYDDEPTQKFTTPDQSRSVSP